MEIAGYVKTSLIEWPGKISSVIFVPGCNFRCPFCHNADLVSDEVERFTRIDEKQILADLLKRKKWTEAVVVTGGEPTLQLDLSRFLGRLKQMGFLTMIHTNGTKPEVISQLSNYQIENYPLVDYWAMDIKGNFDNYRNFTNVKSHPATGGTNIKTSIKLIANSGLDFEFRTTIVPGLHDSENLIKLANEIKAILKTKYLIQNTRWFLQQFRPINCLDKRYLKVEPYSEEELKSICRKLQEIIPQTSVRGV